MSKSNWKLIRLRRILFRNDEAYNWSRIPFRTLVSITSNFFTLHTVNKLVQIITRIETIKQKTKIKINCNPLNAIQWNDFLCYDCYVYLFCYKNQLGNEKKLFSPEIYLFIVHTQSTIGEAIRKVIIDNWYCIMVCNYYTHIFMVPIYPPILQYNCKWQN